MRKLLSIFLLFNIMISPVFAGLDIVRSSGITLTGADGIRFIGTSGVTLTGADGFLAYQANGITLTGADGITLTGADGTTSVGPDGATYTGPNGITLTGADGITLTGADGVTLTGADGITLTGADGTQYHVDSVVINRPNGITLTGADGITLTGADGVTLTGADGVVRTGQNGITLTGADGITLTGADGITLTGADGVTLTGADSLTGFGTNGIVLEKTAPSGITLTGADGITLTGADGITLTGADGIVMRNIDTAVTGVDTSNGLQSVDPELAIALQRATDDSTINAIVVYYDAVTDADISQLRQIGFTGGTRFRVLPLVYVSGTRDQIIAVSHLPRVRSIYGNRTLNFNSDPYLNKTWVQRVAIDRDLTVKNGGNAVAGRNVTVAVLDTGVNGQHPDLSGRLVQNVRLVDAQSAPAGFVAPSPIENLPNTDPIAGHGTFVSGIIAGNGASSAGKFSGVAPGAKILGLSAGDVNLTSVLTGFDYLLEKGNVYNVRVVNCSFSANTVFDYNDPVNIATKMLTDRGVSVVVSAGNTGSGLGTLNPYSRPPWVISVGATDEKANLAGFSSRGAFGSDGQPTVVAPGVNIASLRSAASITSLNGLPTDVERLSASETPFYTTASGTSFSAPQVSGAVALMLEANPQLSPAEIKDIIARTATPLPRYYANEVGAGMLNTHAAVIDASFPDRRIGTYRSTLSSNGVSFTTSTLQTFTQSVSPNSAPSISVSMPSNVIKAGFSIWWGLGTNDFGLKVVDPSNRLMGESNFLNLPGIGSLREDVQLTNPVAQIYRSVLQNSLGTGTTQIVFGQVNVTTVNYPTMTDVATLPPDVQADIARSVVANIFLPQGSKFRPDSAVPREDLAAAFVRAGLVPQYISGTPLFTDTREMWKRNAVESAQSAPGGRLFFDATAGDRFYPDNFTNRLTAAVAFVRAAGLDDAATSAMMPAGIDDAAYIPAQWRGYVAVALQKGFLRLDGTKFNPTRALTRADAARAINRIVF